MSEPMRHRDDVVVDVRGLRRRYGSGRTAFEAVRGVDLTVHRGELFALLGTNGAGKTSTVELIEGLDRPSAGSVRVLGLDPYADRAALRPRVGIMLQHAGFPGTLTVTEMADIWQGTLADPRPVAEVLDLVVLGHRARVPIASLSGGEQRRLDLALALMGRPEVLFLDEPTTGLDPQSRRTTWDLIATMLAERVTVLLTTHLLDEAEQLADRIAIMDGGVVAETGTLAELVARQPSRVTFRVADDPARTRSRLDTLERMVGAGCRIQPTGRAGRDDLDPGTRVELTSFEPQSLLRRVLDWADGDRAYAGTSADAAITLHDLRVQPGSLERTFLDIAGRTTTAAPTGSSTPSEVLV